MALAEEVCEWKTWLADALRRGYLLAQVGDAAQAHAAWAAGRDEEGEQAYEAAVEELTAVFGRTVFWGAAREGETAEEAWRRALRIDDVFRYVESVSEMYPLFAGLGRNLPDEESALREKYVTLQEEMGWEGVELPGWDWLVGEEDEASSDDGGKEGK
ncbi:MAG: hypothetical protein U9R15_18490 [Chloroflexota bacterium]|nr:hypothetical protein [Chloroflexota bacterium]